jgi:hypothetical protein
MRRMVSEQIYDAGFAAVRAHVTGVVTSSGAGATAATQEARA